MSTKWKLEIHDETKGSGSILSFFEFDDFPSLRLKIVENRGRAFRVTAPDYANQTELTRQSARMLAAFFIDPASASACPNAFLCDQS